MANKVIENLVEDVMPKKYKNTKQEIRKRIFEKIQNLREMANYSKRDTGLPMNTWIERTEIKNRGGHYI